MSDSSSFSSDSGEFSRLRQDYVLLQEELRQCKADKEFVWSLWKRLQVANPDITQAIGLVLNREKEKWDAKEKKLSETICHRDGCIDELKRSAAKQSEEISELITSKIEANKLVSELQSKLDKSQWEIESLRCQVGELESKTRDSASREAIRELDKLNLELKQQINVKEQECEKLRKAAENSTFLQESQRQRLANLEDDNRSVEERNRSLLSDNQRLQGLLKRCDIEMENQKFIVDSKDREMESLRRELSDLWLTHRQTVEHNNQQAELIKQMQQLHSDTQCMMHKQEEAFTVELATHQCRVHDLEQVIAGLKERFLPDRLQQSLESSNTQSEDSVVSGQVSALQTELAELKQKMHSDNPLFRTERTERHTVRDTVDRAISPFQLSTEFSERKSRSRSLTAVDRRPSSPETRRHDVDNLQQKLRVADAKMSDLKSALSAKNNELEIVQTAHSRRLARLQSVITSYQLVKQQLKLYEDDYMCTKKKRKKPAHSQSLPRASPKQLQNEDSDVVWNELTHFKKENKTLKIEKLKEESDQLQVKTASDISTIHELRCCLQEHSEEVKMLRDQLNHVRHQCDSSTKQKIDIAKTQLDKACRDIGSLREEIHRLKMDKDELLSEKSSLLSDLVRLQKRESKHRIDVCNFRREVFRLQRKLRKKPVHSSRCSKQANYKPGPPPDTRLMGCDGDGFWEDVALSDGADVPSELIASQSSNTATSNTSCSLGQAIVMEAHSRRAVIDRAVVDGRAATQHRGDDRYVCQEPTRTSTPTLERLPIQNTLSVKQKQLIKEYVKELTKQKFPAHVEARNLPAVPCSPEMKNGQPVAQKASVSASRTIASLKQRVAGLQQQVMVLKQSKEAAVKGRAELQTEVDGLTEQLNVFNQKLMSSRQLAQRTSTELERVRLEKEAIEAKMAEYSFDTSMCSVASKPDQELINSLQSRLKMSSASLTKQLEHIKLLKVDNEKQSEKISHQNERINHLERDLAQKRVLMDDIKLKLTIAQENAEADADVMLEVEVKLKSLHENNARLKTQVECLKSRLASVTRDKYQSDSTVSRLSGEIDRKTKLMSEQQKRLCEVQSRLSEVEHSAEQHMRSLALHTETAIDTAQSRLSAADIRLKELLKFVKVFAFTLLSTSKQIRLLLVQQKAKFAENNATTCVTSLPSTQRSGFLSDKANISQSDLSELLVSTAVSDDITLSDAEAKDVKWAKRCEELLQSEAGFALALVNLFMEKVEEKSSLAVELRTR